MEMMLSARLERGLVGAVADAALADWADDLEIRRQSWPGLPTGVLAACYGRRLLVAPDLAPSWLQAREPDSVLALERGHRRAYLARAIAGVTLDIPGWVSAYPPADLADWDQDTCRVALAAGWLLLGEWACGLTHSVQELASYAGCPQWIMAQWRALATQQHLDRWYWRLRAS